MLSSSTFSPVARGTIGFSLVQNVVTDMQIANDSSKPCWPDNDAILLEHISLDGYLAGDQGEMDWINTDDAV